MTTAINEASTILAGQRWGYTHYEPGMSFGDVVRAGIRRVEPMYRQVNRRARRCFIVGICLGAERRACGLPL